MKTTGFIKRFLGTKKVGKVEDKPATELTLRIIETHVLETRMILVGMSGNLEKMAKGMDSLSKYFELQIKRQEEMDKIENAPPTRGDLLY